MKEQIEKFLEEYYGIELYKELDFSDELQLIQQWERSQWKSVEDGVPEKNDYYITEKGVLHFQNYKGNSVWLGRDSIGRNPTHWRHLPVYEQNEEG